MTEESPEKKKAKRAELITPPNTLKEKVGDGGFKESDVVKAQDEIKNNKVDFKPIAAELITQMDKAVADARSGVVKDAAAVRGIMAPAMQLRAQGSMFHYPQVSEIGNLLVNFLELLTVVDEDALEIVTAHKTAMGVVLSGRVREEDKLKVGNELCAALLATCNRYYKTRKG